MKQILFLLIAVMFIACKDPKVEAAKKANEDAKERLEFSEQILKNTNMTIVINKAGMKKGMDTVYMILDTNVTAAKAYYDALYNRAEAKVFKK